MSFFRFSFWTLRAGIVIGVLFFSSADMAAAQRIAKYGADFLAGGVGARALGMGGAFVALAEGANAGYWNPAGLEGIDRAEIAYMHAERFSGVVSFDYAGIAWPLSEKTSIGVSFYRSGVNDIKNTLDAWDATRDQPRPNPGDFVTSFSAVDYAFFFGYGRTVSRKLRIGVTGKIIRRSIGDFADAWGYSFDAGFQYRTGRWLLGANVQDLSTMLQSWTINSEALSNIRDVFGDDLPKGDTELVLPVLRLGSGYRIDYPDSRLLIAFDVDVAFDGQQANVMNLGNTSFHPRVGFEYLYRNVVALRSGFSRIQKTKRDGWDVTPSVGAGFIVRKVQFDYGFGDFAGLVSELGFSHRISVKLILSGSRFARKGTE